MKLFWLVPLTLLAFFAVLLMHLNEADAKVMPEIWDGTCIPIEQRSGVKQNPDDVKLQTGYIPKELIQSFLDIETCIFPEVIPGVPPTLYGGPK